MEKRHGESDAGDPNWRRWRPGGGGGPARLGTARVSRAQGVVFLRRPPRRCGVLTFLPAGSFISSATAARASLVSEVDARADGRVEEDDVRPEEDACNGGARFRGRFGSGISIGGGGGAAIEGGASSSSANPSSLSSPTSSS